MTMYLPSLLVAMERSGPDITCPVRNDFKELAPTYNFAEPTSHLFSIRYKKVEEIHKKAFA